MAQRSRVRLALVVGSALTAFVSCMLSAVVFLDPPPPRRADGRARESLASSLRRRCHGQDLAEMARRRGVEFSSVALKSFGGVRGLSATRPIRKGDTLVSVPKKYLFSYTNTERSLRKLWDANPDVKELDRLVLTVMHEAGKPGASEWDYYLCGVPGPEALGPPVVWTRDRLATYCNQEQYDQFCTYVTKRTEYYKYIWEQITYPLISALPSVFGERGRYLKYEDYAWALSAVLSRMWNMRDEDAVEFHNNGTHIGQDKWIMAPFAELFNHQPGAGHIQWRNNDDRTNIFEVVSDRAYRPGEQVFLSYGDYKCNLQLLLEYGFELENNTATCPEENATRPDAAGGDADSDDEHDDSDDDDDDHDDDDDDEEDKGSAPTPRAFLTRSHGRAQGDHHVDAGVPAAEGPRGKNDQMQHGHLPVARLAAAHSAD